MALKLGIDYRKLTRKERRALAKDLNYKYITLRRLEIQTMITGYNVRSNDGCFHLRPSGIFSSRAGTMWDGPSGPTRDRKTTMGGSLWHDGGYRLCRDGRLDPELVRDPFDILLLTVLRRDGAWMVTALWYYWGTQRFAGFAAEED